MYIIPFNFKCVAPGYGEIGGNYGNGCVLLKDLDALDVLDPQTRQELIDGKLSMLRALRAEKVEEISKYDRQIWKLMKL